MERQYSPNVVEFRLSEYGGGQTMQNILLKSCVDNPKPDPDASLLECRRNGNKNSECGVGITALSPSVTQQPRGFILLHTPLACFPTPSNSDCLIIFALQKERVGRSTSRKSCCTSTHATSDPTQRRVQWKTKHATS